MKRLHSIHRFGLALGACSLALSLSACEPDDLPDARVVDAALDAGSDAGTDGGDAVVVQVAWDNAPEATDVCSSGLGRSRYRLTFTTIPEGTYTYEGSVEGCFANMSGMSAATISENPQDIWCPPEVPSYAGSVSATGEAGTGTRSFTIDACQDGSTD